MNKLSAIFLFGLATMMPVQAKIKLPNYITDNMIVQQNSVMKIAGSAAADSKVTVWATWDSHPMQTKADKNGNFEISLPTPAAGGPYSIIIADKDSKVKIGNVLSGEVWLCSGQSNMEFPIEGWSSVMDADHVVSTARNPDIRLLQVKRGTSLAPMDDIEVNMRGWVEAAPNTMGFSAIAYFYAKELRDSLRVPVGVIDATWGGTPAEAWTSSEYLKDIPGFEIHKQQEENRECPSVLYNAMIHPLRDFKVKGVLWYQGCNNVGRAKQYEPLFQSLIKNWRNTWGEDFPFYFVQLAGYRAPQAVQPDSEWAALRNAQSKALQLPNTAMVSAIDLGNPGDIHPREKQTVAHRLALTALGRDYGFDTNYKAPLCISTKNKGDRIILEFDDDLTATSSTMLGFIIGDINGNFDQAIVKKIDNRTLELYSPLVKKPICARYNWADFPNGNLYSPHGIPVAPFATDK
jgi:sialate O-acetylesterase